MEAPIRIEARGIALAFGGVRALNGVDLALRSGEVHAITGENGAGKSSLAKVIAGVYRPNAGTLLLDGVPVEFANPRLALAKGIALVHQEPHRFPDLTVGESIFAGHLPRSAFGTVDWKQMRNVAAAVMERVGLKYRPDDPAATLSIADQQLMELAAALIHDAKVIILDETTASLTPNEANHLFEVARRLRDEGCALAFVSHKLDEVFSLCDRITVLRDGAKVGELATKQSAPSDVVKMMVGRDIEIVKSVRTKARETVALRAEKVQVTERTPPVSFDLREGEIVVLAGLVGAGRTELVQTFAGVTRPFSGTVHLRGETVSFREPVEALEKGIFLVPEDRRQHGLLLSWSITDNISLPVLSRLSRLWSPDRKSRVNAVEWISKLQIACRGPIQAVVQLSGGNQQKVVLAKALGANPSVLIVDEPTRGVDVGAKAEIHRLLRELTGAGLAVLVVSSDLGEVLTIADRVLVMKEGAIVGEVVGDDLSEERIMRLATGQEVASA